MRITVGAPVLLRVTAGVADTSLVHLPQPVKPAPSRRRYGGGRPDDHVLAIRMGRPCPPLDWPALCGLTGWVYLYDTVIRGICFCPICLARWTPEPRVRSPHRPAAAHARPRHPQPVAAPAR